MLGLSTSDFASAWQVWSSRILVTLAIMAVWEWRQRNLKLQLQQSQPQSEPTSSVLRYEPMAEERSSSTAASALLDRLEELQKQQQVQNPDVDSTTNDPKHNNEVLEPDTIQLNQSPIETTVATTNRSLGSSKPKKGKSVSHTPSSTPLAPPPIAATTNEHPGMKAFCYWYEIETSLFRIYTLARHDGVEVVPPYIPHSYRGTVPVHVHVTNTTSWTLKVYWVDYKGKHVLKGTMQPGQVWTQNTWIDHPWVFEVEPALPSDGPTQQQQPLQGQAPLDPTPVLYYIPYRVIPTLPHIPTVSPDDETIGMHKFAITPSQNSNSSPFYVGIEDTVYPFPPEQYFTTPLLAITWTLNHLTRMGYTGDDPTVELLQKYLKNIVNAPDNIKYRQLRIASSKFGMVWKSPPLQGLLLAVGFVQVHGYAELGCSHEPLSRDRIQDLALLSYLIAKWQNEQKQQQQQQSQPQGVLDGYGRAGFGMPGSMAT